MWREPTSLISLSQLLGESTFLSKPNECEGLAEFGFQKRRRTAAVEKDSEKGRMSVQASISHTTGKGEANKKEDALAESCSSTLHDNALGGKKKRRIKYATILGR